jgi:hypothetical protein
MRYSGFFSLLVVALLSTSLFAQKRADFSLKSPIFQIETHAPIDVGFNVGKNTPEQPFEIDFGAVFQHENGSKLQVPGSILSRANG